MSGTKKAFVELVAFLEANADKKVKSIMPDILEMTSAKSGGGGGAASTFVKNEAGEVIAIRCFYHQTWMDPRIVPFGAKQSSATGYNSMCKSGVSKWTKQQREFKQAQEAMLKAVQAGEIKPEQIADELAKAEEAKKVVLPLEGNYQGFATAEECIAFSEANPGFVYEAPHADADEVAA